MPEMVFAGSREAQKSQTRWRKMAKNSQKVLAHVTKMGVAYIMNSLLKIQEKYNFCFVRPRDNL